MQKNLPNLVIMLVKQRIQTRNCFPETGKKLRKVLTYWTILTPFIGTDHYTASTTIQTYVVSFPVKFPLNRY